MKSELKFLFKVIRNGLILAGLFFVSIWGTGNLNWIVLKPVVLFLILYILTELAKRYGLEHSKLKTNVNTLIF